VEEAAGRIEAKVFSIVEGDDSLTGFHSGLPRRTCKGTKGHPRSTKASLPRLPRRTTKIGNRASPAPTNTYKPWSTTDLPATATLPFHSFSQFHNPAFTLLFNYPGSTVSTRALNANPVSKRSTSSARFRCGYFTKFTADISAHARKQLRGNDFPFIPFFIFSTDVPDGTLLQIAVVFLQEHFVRKSYPGALQTDR